MLTFTLAISCLTTSNLPWFMDLTFQVPMQYCSLQPQTLLPSPVTSTTGWCFCFGSVSSFFLELFLHWSPVACWAPTYVASSSFMSYLLAFSCYSWGHEQKQRLCSIRVAPYPRSGRRQRGATPCLMSGVADEGSFPKSKVRSSSCTLLEQPRDTTCPS